MKIIVFKDKGGNGKFRVGFLKTDEMILDATSIVSDEGLNAFQINECFNLGGGFPEKMKAAAEGDDLPSVDRRDVKICAPVPAPEKIICIGLNYRDHAEESGMEIPKSPVIFSKFPTSVIGPGDGIICPEDSEQVDYEAELAFVIGRKAKNVKAEDAFGYVLGYTNFNDVSARDFQFADGQWQRGKSCDTFAPMGEYIATTDEIENPHELQIQFRLNGQILQNSNTRELIFKIPELIEFLSRSITLKPGDVIATGTPPGVGFARRPPVFMKPGDTAEVEIEGLGTLKNKVTSDE